jgi:charged multivesicular body protein 5
MKAAAKDMKQQFKSKALDINAIDKLNDEMADLMGLSSEVQEALGRNYAVPDDLDEEELLGELDDLEVELASEREAGAAGAVPSYLLDEAELPAAPVGAPGAAAEGAEGAEALPARPAAQM